MISKGPEGIKSGSKIAMATLESIEDNDLFKFVLKSESGNISLANLQDQLDKLNQKFTED